MTFRKATQSDAVRCLEIYDAVSDWEAVNGRQTCWERGFYPTMETVQTALATGDLYVLEDEIDGKTVIVASGKINFEQPEYYKNFDWKTCAPDNEILVLHTFGVHPELQRRGYGQAFMAHYEKLARSLGCRVLRLDTVSSNQKSQAMYKKLGFWETGRWEGDPNGVGCTLVFVGLEKNAN